MDSADVVMLSGETSVGEFPVRVVEVMHKIIDSVEATYPLPGMPTSQRGEAHRHVTDGIRQTPQQCLLIRSMQKAFSA